MQDPWVGLPYLGQDEEADDCVLNGPLNPEGYCIGIASTPWGPGREVMPWEGFGKKIGDGYVRVLFPDGTTVPEIPYFVMWKDCEEVVIHLNNLVGIEEE